MVNDCLVTKLKSQVDNANLDKLGVFKINVPAYTFDPSDALGKNGIIFYSDTAGKYITVKGTKNFLTQTGEDSGIKEKTTDSLASACIIYPNNTGDTIEVSVKYNMTRMNIYNPNIVLNLGKINYMPITFILCYGSTKGNVSDFKEIKQTLRGLDILNWNEGTCDSAELAELSKDNIREINLNGTALCGHISEFGKCTQLTKLWFRGANQDVDSVENLVKVFVSNGKTTGSINFLANPTKVTFNGSGTVGGQTTLAWEPYATGQTKVTYHNFTPIIIDNATGEVVK